ncbi:MAG: hypothetical protein HY245_12370 [Rhizobiales bacterium]|nr:hypothetical protein [Hyphomicrobiales bacterium]MBI3674184.1 hypothetical protein [Hyphomicrobiales bacterium]
MKVVLFGDSHVVVLAEGLARLQTEGRWPQSLDVGIHGTSGLLLRGEFFADRGDHAELLPLGLQRGLPRLPLADQSEGGVIHGLGALYHSAEVWRHPQWQRFAPIGCAREEWPVSDASIGRMMQQDQKWMFALLDILIRTGAKIFAIETPRPFRHHRALSQMRTDVALTVDRIYRAAVREELLRRSVPTLEVPAECVDADGFMLDSYASSREADNHHANEQFGGLMLERLPDFLTAHFSPD